MFYINGPKYGPYIVVMGIKIDLSVLWQFILLVSAKMLHLQILDLFYSEVVEI
jgi:hypothetical protein